MYRESPGSISNQIGRSINAIRDCVENDDVLGVGDHLRMLIALVAPKLDEPERAQLVMPVLDLRDERRGRLTGRARGRRGARRVERMHRFYVECMDLFARVLVFVSAKNLYAYTSAPQGDGGSELALRDPEEVYA